RAVLFEHLGELDHGGALLADRYIDAVELDLLVVRGVERLLIEDGIERNRGLAGLAVADDELALATADGDEGVDRLEPGGHRLVDRRAPDGARGPSIDAAGAPCLEPAPSVARAARRGAHP